MSNDENSTDNYISKDNFITVQKGMLFFFLIISGNYIGELLSCRTQKLFGKSMVSKHVIALISLYFFVVISDSKLQQYNPVITLLGTFLIYVYFLCMAKVEARYFIITLFILTVIAFFQIYRQYLKKKDDNELGKIERSIKQNIDKIQTCLIIISLLITLIGLLVYMGMKKIEYNKDFKYNTFFIGKPVCADNLLGKTPPDINKNIDVSNTFKFSNMLFFIKTALTK